MNNFFTTGNIAVLLLGVLSIIFFVRIWKVKDSKAFIQSIFKKRSTIIEALLVVINMVEAIVAMSVVNDSNVPESVRLIMHLGMAAFSSVFGFGILPQVNDIFSAVMYLAKGSFIGGATTIFGKTANMFFAILNIFKQIIDVYLAVVMSVIGPLGNWILICYFEGDLKVTVNLNGGFFKVIIDFVTFNFGKDSSINLLFDTSLEAWSISSLVVVIIHLVAILALSLMSFDMGLRKLIMPHVDDDEKEEEKPIVAATPSTPIPTPAPVPDPIELDWTDDGVYADIEDIHIKPVDIINYASIYGGQSVDYVREWLSTDMAGIASKSEVLKRLVLNAIHVRKLLIKHKDKPSMITLLNTRLNRAHDELTGKLTMGMPATV